MDAVMVSKSFADRVPRGIGMRNRLALFRLKPVPDPGFGQDVAWRLAGLDLLSKLIDEHPQIFRLFHALSAPDGVEQNAVSQHLVRFARHVGEKIKLFGREMDLFADDRDDSLLPVNAEISSLNYVRQFGLFRLSCSA